MALGYSCLTCPEPLQRHDTPAGGALGYRGAKKAQFAQG